MFTCKYCGKKEKRTGSNQCTCAVCKKHLLNVHGQVHRDIIRMKKFGTYCEIGKGNAQGSGENSPFFKTGIGSFHKAAPRIKEEIRYCQRCGKDLLFVGKNLWCVHHKDGDRTNNKEENYELLCKRCHQLEHNCQDNLPR